MILIGTEEVGMEREKCHSSMCPCQKVYFLEALPNKFHLELIGHSKKNGGWKCVLL